MSDRIIFESYGSASDAKWLRKPGVTIFIGENGAGKSRLLSQIERSSTRKGYVTIAIANTPFDKFRGPSGGSRRLLARRGGAAPERVLKAAVASADEVALRRISRILRYCGYLPDVGIQIELVTGARRGSQELALLQALSPEDAAEVEAIWSVLNRPDFSIDTIWFDFDSTYVEYSYRSVLPKIFRWERLLRRMKMISSIRLFLRKPGIEIPVAAASSGELSLISTMTYLASLSEKDEAVVLIDEPENSLHPRWQREYLELILEATKYRVRNLFVATHSPLIVSAAFAESDDISMGVEKVVVLGSHSSSEEMEPPNSVEGILAEIFNVVTPANHYLSQALVRLLDEVDENPRRKPAVREQIGKFRSAMPDEKQVQILDAVSEMVENMPNTLPDADIQ